MSLPQPVQELQIGGTSAACRIMSGVHDLRNAKVVPGFDAIRPPGERRRRCQIERAREGVPNLPEVLAQLDRLGEGLAIAPLLSRASQWASYHSGEGNRLTATRHSTRDFGSVIRMTGLRLV